MFCDSLVEVLKCKVGVFNLSGKLVEGENLGFKFTDDIEYIDGKTYIRAEEFIICADSLLSQDACRLVKFVSKYLFEKEAGFLTQPLTYILRNNLPNESIQGRYNGYTVFYIKSSKNILDTINNIYEGQVFEIAEDSEGIYIAKEIEEMELEANSIIGGISEENGVNIILGSGRIVDGAYTIKDSAYHAKEAAILAQELGFKEGFYPIDRMMLYSIINSAETNKIQENFKGGYSKFLDIINDKELISTAEALFRCNLNISEASRKTFIHRNTLLYRIEKIKTITGLDIKNFEDAVIFKTILAVYRLKFV